MPKKPTKSQIKKERSPTKIEKVLIKKGYPSGKPPKGKVAHHVTPIVEGGKSTKKNIRVISEPKHKKIHAERRKRGKV